MSGHLDALAIRRRLGRDRWGIPTPHGPDGWNFLSAARDGSVIVSCATLEDGVEWVHASIAHAEWMPTYSHLRVLHEAVWPNGWALQVFAPPEHHINIHPYALHLWGRLDGQRIHPDFTGGVRSI